MTYLSPLLGKCHAYALLMRWHRPVGVLLLLWPSLWALWIAGNGKPSLLLVLIFILGVFLTRSAGCVINDFADRHWDGAVKRTSKRPLIAGLVSAREALGLFTVLSLLAACLLLPLNNLARCLALPALLLMIIYPYMKRFTRAPQLVLGLAFGWGIPMAFAAQTGQVPLIAWFLFLLSCIWTLAYDTIYALVDREDDLRIGIKSSAILLGRWDTRVIAGLHAVMLALLVILGQQLRLGPGFYFSLLAVSGIMVYLHYLIKERQVDACLLAFSRSQWVGCMVFLGLVFS
jgi:4-hydroxybenzoate polyprenyltransferase